MDSLQRHTKPRRKGPPPQGLAVVERIGRNIAGQPYEVKVAVANVTVNGFPVSSNAAALLLAERLQEIMVMAPADRVPG
jgi:hypothetical protein